MLNERALEQHVGQLGVAVLDDQTLHAIAPAGSTKVKGPRGEARAETLSRKISDGQSFDTVGPSAMSRGCDRRDMPAWIRLQL
jgi:hypothetical protein